MPWLKDIPKIRGKNVLVMGLGLFSGGAGLVKYLVNQNAYVTVTDLRNRPDLEESIKALKNLDVKFVLGKHKEEDFIKADIIFVNPAVKNDSAFLKLALRKRKSLETEVNLFFKLCPTKKIIGVTGTNGKTTTTVLIYEILKAGGKNAHIGGNLGISLVQLLENIKKDDLVVVELSSFQLARLGFCKISPHIAVVTNISPNHLDYHKDMNEYVSAKKNIIRFQKKNDYAILNGNDEYLLRWQKQLKGNVAFFNCQSEKNLCSFFEDGNIVISDSGKKSVIISKNVIKLPGDFNIENVETAVLTARIVGVDDMSMTKAVKNFKGIEHRLELVGEINGIQFINDSIATNPTSTIKALQALDGKIYLIAGGYDKNLPLDDLVDNICSRTEYVSLVGMTKKILFGKLSSKGFANRCFLNETYEEAVRKAFELAKNDTNKLEKKIVLLSPAFASFDMFRNFEERGNVFKNIVKRFLMSQYGKGK